MSLHAVKYHTISKVGMVLVNSVHIVGERLHNKIKSLQKCSKSWEKCNSVQTSKPVLLCKSEQKELFLNMHKMLHGLFLTKI